MDAANWIAVVAALIAFGSLAYGRASAVSAKRSADNADRTYELARSGMKYTEEQTLIAGDKYRDETKPAFKLASGEPGRVENNVWGLNVLLEKAAVPIRGRLHLRGTAWYDTFSLDLLLDEDLPRKFTQGEDDDFRIPFLHTVDDDYAKLYGRIIGMDAKVHIESIPDSKNWFDVVAWNDHQVISWGTNPSREP